MRPTIDVCIPHLGWLRFQKNDEVASSVYQGHFEAAEQVFYRRYLRSGDTYVDAGAHVGFFSVLAGQLVGPNGRVLAFEPDEFSRKLLLENLAKNTKAAVQVKSVGLWKEDTTLVFQREKEGMSSHNHVKTSEAGEGGTRIEVRRLDSFTPGAKGWDLLKIDCEGAEHGIIEGAHTLLSSGQVAVVMIEFNEHNLTRAGSSTEQLFAAIKKTGLQCFRYDAHANRLNLARHEKPIWYENLFLCADPEAVSQRLEAKIPGQGPIVADTLQRAQACSLFKELEELPHYKERAALTNEFEDWAKRTEESLKKERELKFEFEDWAKRTEESLKKERELKLNYQNISEKERELKLYYQNISEKMLSLVDLKGRIPGLELDPEQVQEFLYASKPDVSVIICTHNPAEQLLEETFRSLANQSLNIGQWELIVVDNNSTNNALAAATQKCPHLINMRMVKEFKQGLTHARIKGFTEAKADLCVLVDDDNFLDPDYLQNALIIARDHPRVGAFGGISEPQFETPPGKFTLKATRHLAIRNYGDDPITSNQDEWGKWEPIGAGMVVRADVIDKFASIYKEFENTAQLGRTGNQLLGGEDSLLARCAYRLGYACSYQPKLKLIHYIPKGRVQLRYLARLSCGQGRTYVTLNHLLGNDLDLSQANTTRAGLLRKLYFRLRNEGLSGVIEWLWDVGYYLEARELKDQA